jgi:hypothetical protein
MIAGQFLFRCATQVAFFHLIKIEFLWRTARLSKHTDLILKVRDIFHLDGQCLTH